MRNLLFMLIPLVFCGAGILMASLFWGRHKQQALALRRQLAQREENEATLAKKLRDLSEDHQAQSVTCHTLEQEIARIATEQETVLADASQARTDRSRLRRYEAECVELTEKLEALKEKTLSKTSSLEESLRAAENRAHQVSKEKDELLDLVGKLQSKLDQIAPLQSRLLNAEQQNQQAARASQLKNARRSARRSEPSKPASRRRPSRSRSPIRDSKNPYTPASEPSGSATQRLLSKAAKLMPRGNHPSKRHW